jgi:hypothetical protein
MTARLLSARFKRLRTPRSSGEDGGSSGGTGACGLVALRARFIDLGALIRDADALWFLRSASHIIGGLLLNFGKASLSGEFLKLKGVVARHDAIGRASKLNHAVLIADVGGVVRVGEGGAGFVFDEIAIEV